MAVSTSKQTIQLFWKHIWRYPKYVIGLIIWMPIATLVHQFLPPYIAARVLDDLSAGNYQAGDLWGSFGSELLAYGALVLFGGTIGWRVAIYLNWKLEGYVQRDLLREQFNHLLVLSAQFHANSFAGSLVSQTNKLAGAYQRFFDTTQWHVYQLTTMLLISSVILWQRSVLFVILMLVVSFAFVGITYHISKPIAEKVAREAKQQNKTTGVLADALSNIMAVKSFAALPMETRRFDKQTETTRKATISLMRTTLTRELLYGAITSAMTIAALVIAVLTVVVYDAEIGTVFLLLSYSNTVAGKLWGFSQNALRNYNRAFGDAQEAVKMLAMEPAVKDPSRPEMVQITDGAIDFIDVNFRHADSNDSKLLFQGLNLSIQAGEKIGLVGHSGSGKTSLTKVLLRYADINGGTIEIDGQNIAKITQSDLRKNIAYVPQEPLLFHRSIAENIGYGSDKIDEKRIIRASKQANAHDFIKDLPDGYATLVGERGIKLSGGQRQRVAIARALLKDAPILVLDEATSALDSESERLIQQALWTLMEGRTAIVIAHRLSTIQRMDRIVVMEAGAIIEQGSHTELLEHAGVYADLWAHQSGGFIDE